MEIDRNLLLVIGGWLNDGKTAAKRTEYTTCKLEVRRFTEALVPPGRTRNSLSSAIDFCHLYAELTA